jgi:hypothetical protein
LQFSEITRTDVARNVGTIPGCVGLLPLLVPTAAVVPLVPVAGLVVVDAG